VADFYLSEGNRLPVIVEDLYGPDGALLDLTGATVTFIYTLKRQVEPDRGGAAVIVSVNGRVSYAWQVGDSDKPGPYDYQWHVVYADGRAIDVPNANGYRLLLIQPRL
jgi:hypothetical protein